MPINPSIALQVRPPEIESPLNALAKVTQVQNAMNQNRLFDMQVAESQRKQQRQNKLMEISGGWGENTTDEQRISGLRNQGFFEEADKLETSTTTRKKNQAELDAKGFELAQKRYDTYRKEAGALFNDPNVTSDKVIDSINRLTQAQMLPPELAQTLAAAVPSDPAALRDFLRQGVATQLTPEQVLTAFAPKVDKTDTGGAVKFIDTNPNSPTFGREVVSAQRKTMTPGEIAADARGREANALKKKEIGVMEQGVVGKRVQDVELKLQDDYRTESKGFSETSTAMKKILGAIETADKNPGSALAAGTAFMKLLDPTSVVRESELGMALNASGWFDRAMNIANTLQSGRVMTPAQKSNLKKASEDLFEEAKAAQREIDTAYVQRAKDYGADPKRVIVDRGQNTQRASNGMKPGTVMDGYRFKGGDPANQANWEKM